MADRNPFRLPAKILNRRLELGIEDFFDEIIKFARTFGIDPPNPKREEDRWSHPDFNISILHKRLDKTPLTFEFTLKRIPGIVKSRNGRISTKTKHVFSFNIPRSYPHDLEKIKITCHTPLYHPRISEGIHLPVCYIVNGEIDRILLDIVFNVLMRPDLIRPPSIYTDSDWGYNSLSMKWYQETGPEQVYLSLLKHWLRIYKKDFNPTIPLHKKSRISFLKDDENTLL